MLLTQRFDTITCAQKLGVLPHTIHYTQSNSLSIELATSLNETVLCLNPREKKIQRHPPPLTFLVNHAKIGEAITNKRVSRGQ